MCHLLGPHFRATLAGTPKESLPPANAVEFSLTLLIDDLHQTAITSFLKLLPQISGSKHR